MEDMAYLQRVFESLEAETKLDTHWYPHPTALTSSHTAAAGMGSSKR